MSLVDGNLDVVRFGWVGGTVSTENAGNKHNQPTVTRSHRTTRHNQNTVIFVNRYRLVYVLDLY